jgi:hypothetical protein
MRRNHVARPSGRTSRRSWGRSLLVADIVYPPPDLVAVFKSGAAPIGAAPQQHAAAPAQVERI